MLRFRSVIFDCDSTLSALEGIDELGRNHGEEIARLTEKAMAGQVPLERVYGQRLALIRPGRRELERVGRLYIERLVPGVASAISCLTSAGAGVWVLSGGLAPAVRVVAAHLGIAPDRVAAVDISFDPEGEYAGYDEQSPLTRSGGKRDWIEAHRNLLPGPVVMVGDGATDLETRPVVDCFVAFAGVARREAVVAAADQVVDGPGMEGLLPIVLA